MGCSASSPVANCPTQLRRHGSADPKPARQLSRRGCSAADLPDRYRLRTTLGRGSYGIVVLASDTHQAGRLVAVKKASAGKAQKKFVLEREAAVLAKLQHPNICALLDECREGTQFFLVLEYYKGGDIFDRLEHRVFQEKEAADIFRQLASAVRHAHGRQIAHRDLKPDNVCFECRGASPAVKVIDWGEACDFNSASMGSTAGTLPYMAPEVMEAATTGRRYTGACDLWSLGATLYVILSGDFPFAGPFAAQLGKKRREEYKLPESKWAKVSDDCRALVRGLLHPQPAARPPLDGALVARWCGAGPGSCAAEDTAAAAAGASPETVAVTFAID